VDTLGLLAQGFVQALTPQNLLFALLCSVLGTLVSVLPGIGPTSGIAILLPLTTVLPPTPAIIMLAAIYYGAMYGGSTTAILVNIPGGAEGPARADRGEVDRSGRGGGPGPRLPGGRGQGQQGARLQGIRRLLGLFQNEEIKKYLPLATKMRIRK
jgi:hypothetical protein